MANGPGLSGGTKITISNNNVVTVDSFDQYVKSNIYQGNKAQRKIDYKNAVYPVIKTLYDKGLLDINTKITTAQAGIQNADEKAKLKTDFDKAFLKFLSDPDEDIISDLAYDLIAYPNVPFNDFIVSPVSPSKINDSLNSFVEQIFERHANKNVDTGIQEFFGGGDFLNIEEFVDSLKNKDRGALTSALSGQGVTDAQEEFLEKVEPLELKQCALMSIMFNSSITHIDNSFVRNLSNTAGFPYRKRIILIDTNSQNTNPSGLNNFFYCDDNVSNFFETKTSDGNMFKDLFYVYEDVSGSMKEVKLNFSTANDTTNVARQISDINQKIYDAQLLGKAAEVQDLIDQKAKVLQEHDANKRKTLADNTSTKINKKGDIALELTKFSLDKIDIEFNGTNPSTARDDVKVSITFNLESFSALEEDISENISAVGREADTPLKLSDLVTAALGDDGTAGSLSALRSVYSPSQNRIRLKYAPDGSVSTTGKKITPPPRIIDLALVDHTLSRDSNSSSVKFTINYRGYMQSLLQMPFANVLLTSKILINRRLRQGKINEIIKKECSVSTLREILRVERSTAEIEVSSNFSVIFDKLLSLNAIGIYQWNKPLTTIVNDVVEAGKTGLISVKTYTNTGGSLFSANQAVATALEIEKTFLENASNKGVKQGEGAEGGISQTGLIGSVLAPERTYGNFFYFGDLLYAVTDILYTHDDNMIPEIKDKLKFILMPIQIPDPKSSSGFIQINPAWIPIDTYFFAQWWHETIVKKDLSFYPMSAFMRDLAERLINNLLYEVCISNLLPDESPPLLRSSYFSSDEDFFSRQTGRTSAYKNQNSGQNYSFHDYSKMKKPFFKFDYNGSPPTGPTDMKSENYICLYSSLPPYKRELNNKSANKKLYADNLVPTIIHGMLSKNMSSHVDSVSFSKTTTQGLREARYFNNSFGSLALMNNVYDLSFNIDNNNPTTYLYPGMLINFVLTDFSRKFVKTSAGNILLKIGPTDWPSTENDPHLKGSRAHSLGFGGYYIVKSINQMLGASAAKHSLKVEAKFLGTEADSLTKSKKGEVIDIIASDKDACKQAYSFAVKQNQAAVSAYNENKDSDDPEISPDFAVLPQTGSAASATTSANQGVANNATAQSSTPGASGAPAATSVPQATTSPPAPISNTVVEALVDQFISSNNAVSAPAVTLALEPNTNFYFEVKDSNDTPKYFKIKADETGSLQKDGYVLSTLPSGGKVLSSEKAEGAFSQNPPPN